MPHGDLRLFFSLRLLLLDPLDCILYVHICYLWLLEQAMLSGLPGVSRCGYPIVAVYWW